MTRPKTIRMTRALVVGAWWAWCALPLVIMSLARMSWQELIGLAVWAALGALTLLALVPRPRRPKIDKAQLAEWARDEEAKIVRGK